MDPVSVRPSSIAGAWYEIRPKALAEEIDRYLDRAELPEFPGDILGVIAPHAGHRYSGPVAGYAFAAVRGRSPDVVAVISPMHYPFLEPLLTADYDAYATPLGEILIDKDALAEVDSALRLEPGLSLTHVSDDREHSLEIELPFLQRALGGAFKILPIMIAAQRPKVSQALGDALAKALKGKNFLLVASTDLSHFYDQKTAETLDTEMLRCIESFTPERIFEAEQTGQGFACGHAAVAAVLWAARALGADTVKVLNHATSGDVTGDYERVVGYGAAVVMKTG